MILSWQEFRWPDFFSLPNIWPNLPTLLQKIGHKVYSCLRYETTPARTMSSMTFKTSLTRDLCWQNDPLRGWILQTEILLNWLSLGHNQVFQPHVDWDENIVQWSKASNNESVRKWEWVPWAPHILCLGSQLHPQKKEKKKVENTCRTIITAWQNNTRSKFRTPLRK